MVLLETALLISWGLRPLRWMLPLIPYQHGRVCQLLGIDLCLSDDEAVHCKDMLRVDATSRVAWHALSCRPQRNERRVVWENTRLLPPAAFVARCTTCSYPNVLYAYAAHFSAGLSYRARQPVFSAQQ